MFFSCSVEIKAYFFLNQSLCQNSETVEKLLFMYTALVKDLRQNQSSEERVAALTDRITNLVNRMHQLEFDRTENNAALIQVHSCAVTLWNIAVAMKTGGQSGVIHNARCKNQLLYLLCHTCTG